MLEARGLTASYGGRCVLHGVDVQVRPGQIVGVIGPNGSGKSTLLRVLAGAHLPDAGQVLLGGQPARRGQALARRLATVFQSEGVPFPFTVRELVTLGRYPHTPAGLGWQQADHAAVDRVLARLELGALAERRFDELSGGEQKRVLLARALAQEPAYLLLDEPTAALDLHHQVALLELLSELRASRDLGLMAVLHDLNLVAQYCDRVVLLANGRVRSEGTPAEVLVYPVLKEVFGVELYIGVNELTGTLHVHPMRRPSPPAPLPPGGRGE